MPPRTWTLTRTVDHSRLPAVYCVLSDDGGDFGEVECATYVDALDEAAKRDQHYTSKGWTELPMRHVHLNVDQNRNRIW